MRRGWSGRVTPNQKGELMALPKLRKVIDLPCTPNQLRRWAEILDAQWAKAMLGDEVPSHTIHGLEIEVRLIIDQDEKYGEEARAERGLILRPSSTQESNKAASGDPGATESERKNPATID